MDIMSQSVCFLTYDYTFNDAPVYPNGCAWYRCYIPSNKLMKNNWKSGMGLPLFDEKYGFCQIIDETKAIRGFDIVVLKLVMLERLVDHIPAAQALGQKIVIDVDDFFEGLDKTNMAYEMSSSEKNPRNNRDHLERSIHMADAVIASTPFLADFYKQRRSNVFMVRNSLDMSLWNTKRKDNGKIWPTIGWVGATPWRSRDLETLNPYMGDFIKKYNLKFHHSGNIIGAPQASDQLGIDSGLSTVQPMEKIYNLPKLFEKIDIGLVPLNDLPFNEAKSFIKGLEYAAMGIPFVAQDMPEYVELYNTGVGRVASSWDDWEKELKMLLDPRERERQRKQNMKNLLKYHTIDTRIDDWENVFNSIAAL